MILSSWLAGFRRTNSRAPRGHSVPAGPIDYVPFERPKRRFGLRPLKLSPCVEMFEARTLLTTTSLQITVTIETDEIDPVDGEISLREAIVLANAASEDEVFINLDVNGALPEVFVLDIPSAGDNAETGDLDITTSKPITIRGSDNTTITVDAPFNDRVFDIGIGANVTLVDLVLDGDSGFTGAVSGAGAGIRNVGSLTVVRSTLQQFESTSNGGAIYNEGMLDLQASVISENSALGNGGGLNNNQGVVSIDATTFDLNAAAGTSNSDGGAIYSDGTIRLQRSLIRRGTAASGQGGGLFYTETVVPSQGSGSIDNSTFGENQASDGAAIWVQSGTLSLTSSTIAQNNAGTGLGIGGVGVNAGIVQVQNTVIANNFNSGESVTDVLGTFASLGNNYIGDADGSTGLAGDTTGSETGAGVIDPNLQNTLTDNGGPTLTYSPIVGTSPLIDAGNVPPVFFNGVEIPQTDQRGAPRSQAVAPDIGAVETGFNGVFVDTTDDEDNDPLGGTGTSLREAVLGVQGAFAGGGYNPSPTIVVLPGVYGLTMGSLGFGPSTSVDVIGFGPLMSEIGADYNSRVIETQSPGLEISGVTLRNGSTASETFKNGGALLNSGMTRLINVHVRENEASGDGGGIASDGMIELQGVFVAGNLALGDGGGLAVGVNSSARIVQSTIALNLAFGDSGGVGVDGNVEIHESSIIENEAMANAGGIGVSETGSLLLNSSGVDSNTAQAAGGVGTRGETTIVFSSITNNTATDGGGIGAEGGHLEVQASNISGNTASGAGGGVYLETLPQAANQTEAIFEHTEIDGNRAVDGGGILSVGAKLTLDKSTIAENLADVTGGGSGGGLFVLSGEAVLTNSTIALNAAGASAGKLGGGIYNSGAQVSLSNVTVTGNSANRGGGVTTDAGGRTDVINTIISANNATTIDPDVANDATSTLNSKGHNVFGFLIGQPRFVLEPGASDDQFGVTNPMLNPLDFNGGSTRTMLPRAASPALDAGDDAVASATDQRGAPRQLNAIGDPGPIDVGATEAGFAGVFVNTTEDIPLAMITGGQVSLRSAIQTANMGSSPVTIVLPAGEYSIGEFGQSENAGATGDFDITTTGRITIIGAGMGLTTIDGAEMDRVLDVHPNANVELRDLSIINGQTEFEVGGGIQVTNADLELTRVELRDNESTNGSGGAIFATAFEFGTVIITDSLIQNNKAALGGAILNDGDLFNISGTLLLQNQATFGGGAIYNGFGTVQLTDSRLEANIASDGLAGAILNDSGTLTITSSVLQGNSAMGLGAAGGAVVSDESGAVLTIDSSEFIANTSSGAGGAIFFEQSATITNSTFESNSAGTNGGAIAVEAPFTGNSTLTLTNSTLSDNFATGPGFVGGGLAIAGDTDITVTILNSTITQNSADAGGGIHVSSTPESPKVELKNSIVSANQAGLFDNDVSGPFSSMAGVTGNNLIGEIGSATGIMSQSGNVISPFPMLRPLGDYTSQPSFVITPDEFNEFIGDQMMMGQQNVTAGSFEAIEPPIVRVHALLPDSMAIDAGNNTNAPTEDQRGIARPVNATVDIGATEFAPVTISGTVFSDHNANGVQDMGELGIQGVTVYVDLDNDGVLDDFGTAGVYEPGFGDEPFLQTDALGSYSIPGLPPFEQYTVRQVEPAGFEQTAPFEVSLGLFGMLTDGVSTGQIGGIVAGDFDGANGNDLVVTLEGSGEVVVFLNDGDGTFTSAAVGGFTGSQSFSIVAADFDGDGDTDLVVANEGNGSVQLLRNNGSGVFTPQTAVNIFQMPAITGIPVDLAAVNLDGDSASELVVVDDLNGTFVVLDYDASPDNFLVSQTADVEPTNPLAAFPSSLAVVDVDGDGNPDLAVTTEGDSSLRVFLGTGSGTFNTTPSGVIATGAEPARVRSADVNGDSKPDLIIVNQTSRTATVALNASTPGTVDLTNVSTYGTILGGETLLLEDFNGDGIPDLLTTSENTSVLSLLLNNGSGVFQEPILFNLMGSEPVEITAIDLNGDGQVDLALTDGNVEQQQVMLLANAFGAHSLVASAGVTLSGNDFANHDTVAPNAPTVDSVTNDTGAGGDGITGDNTLIFNGTAEANSLVEVFINGSSIGTTTASGAGDWSFNHTGTTLSDDTYSITARATDASGNTSVTSGTLTVVVDTAAPGAPTVASVMTDSGSSSTDGVTNDNTLVIGGTAEANSVVEVFIGGSSIGTTMTNGSGDWGFDHTGTTLPDNTYSITAKATDAAGNISATSGTLTIVVDTSAPGAPTVASVTNDTGSSSTDGVTNDNTLIISGTAEANSAVEVFIDGSSIGTTMADGSGDWSLDHTGTTLSDDTYSATATATDAAGNASATSGALTVVVDTSAPGDPAVVSVTNDTGSSSTDGVTSDNTLIITGTAEANSVVEVFIDGASIGTVTADGSGNWSLDHTGTMLADDTYSVTATATDAAGNTSSVSLALSVLIDTAAPATPTVDSVTDDTGTSSTDSVTSDSTLLFSGRAEANSVVEVFIDGSSIGTTSADGSGDWSFDHTGTTLSDDTYSVTATSTDAAGNTSSASLALTVVVDSAIPNSPTVDSVTNDTGASSTDGVTNDSTLVISGTAEANSIVEVFIDGSSVGTTTADGSGDWSFDHTGTSLSDDTYSVIATARDAAGNRSAASPPLTVLVDATAPNAPTVDSVTSDTGASGDGVTSDNTLIFNGTAEANTVVEVFIDGSSIGTTTANGSGDWSFDHTGTTLADGTYSVTAASTDVAGNTSAASDALMVVVDTSAPGGPDVTSPSGPTTVSNVEFSIEGTAEANSQVRVYSDDNNDGMVNGADEVVASLLLTGGETEFAINTPLGKIGENNFVVTATDLAGNESGAVDVATITRQNIQVVGTVWLDADGNGVLDEGGRVEGIAVRVLTLDDGEVVQLGSATATDSNGQYSLTFASQPPEPVVVEFRSVANGVFYRFTQRDVGDDRFDSDAHRLTGRTPAAVLPPTGLIRDAGLIPLTVSINNAVPVDEGQPGDAVTTEFEVTLNGPAPHSVTVRSTAASGTAVLGDDFQQVSSFAQTVTFQPGQTSKTVRVPVLGDLQVEADETFSVTLSMPNGTAIENGGGTATGLIVNDDAAIPTVELVRTASVVEGNAPDRRAMTFVARLQGGAVDEDIEVGFETTGVPIPTGFEAAQAGVDYLPRTGTAVIPAGQTSVEIRVEVVTDNLPEDDQLFGLELAEIVSAGSTGTVLGSRTSTVGRIIDDDVVVPEASIGNAELVELNEPFEPAMRFPVMLDGPADQSVFVLFSSVILEGDGTATAFVDFEPRIDGVLEIPAGQVSGFIDVRVYGDQDVEPDEVIAIEIDGARLEDGTDILLGETLGVGTIINDDVATPLVGFTGNSQVREGRRNEFRQLEFEITLNGPASEDVTVIVSTVNPPSAGATTATPATLDDDGDVSPDGGDFLTFTRRRVVIPKGETSAILAVDIVGDETPENDEELRVRIVGVDGNATLNQARAQAVGTIRNDDRSSVVVTVDPETTVRETDDPKTSVAEFTVRLDAVASESIFVGYRTLNASAFAASGLATPGVDFVPVGATPGSEGVVEFAPGETERTIQIVVLGDRLPESPEDFYLELTSVTGENDAMRPVNAVTGVIIDPIATLDPFESQAKATILDNDSGLAVVSIQSEASVVEPDAPGVVPVTLTVSLDSVLDDDVVVSWRTRTNNQPEHATADLDFAAVNAGTVRIPAGQTQASIAVSVLGDNLQEGDERFVVMLDSVVSGTAKISTSENQGQVRIVDNDFDQPVVRISDAEVIEGDPGDDVDLVFTVELAGRVPDRQVSVELATDRLDEEVPGLARTDGDNRDAFATRRILYFDPNVTTQEFRVRVVPDDRFEADELIFVRLFNPDGVGLDDGANQAVGRIINDDFAVPTLTIGSATMLEGDVPGQNVLEFEVTLDADPEAGSVPTVTVDYDTIDVSAIGGDDYQSVSGTLTFDEDHRSQTILVPINGDTMNEGTEEFIVELSNAVNANLHPGAFQGLGVIENDDAPDVQFRIDSVTQREGNDGTTDFVFTVMRVGQPTAPVTVDFATEAGTALAGIDFLAQSGQLTFLPGGAATQEITVDVIADDLPEEEIKSFFVTLDNPVGATIDPEAAQGSGTILDDDERVFREDGDQELLRIARRIQDLIAEIGNDPNNRELLDLITTLSRDVLQRLNLDVGLVFITDPVDFLLTDVESRTVGYTNSSGEVTEIANAYYSGDAAVELVVIPGADPGLYGLQLSGVGSGEFATAATLVTADGFATTQTTSGVLNGEFELALDLRPNPIADLRNGVFAELAGSARDEAAEQNLKNLTNKQLAASEEARQALENLRSEIRNALNSDDQSPLTNGVFGQLLRRVAELGGDLRDSLKEELEELFGGPLTDLDGQVDPDADKDDDDKEPDTLDTFWRSLGRSLLGTPGHLLNLSDFFDLTGSNDNADSEDGTNENGEQQNDGQNNGAAPNNNGQAQRDDDKQAALMPERYRRLRYWPDGRFAQIDDGKVSPWAQPRQSKSAAALTKPVHRNGTAQAAAEAQADSASDSADAASNSAAGNGESA